MGTPHTRHAHPLHMSLCSQAGAHFGSESLLKAGARSRSTAIAATDCELLVRVSNGFRCATHKLLLLTCDGVMYMLQGVSLSAAHESLGPREHRRCLQTLIQNDFATIAAFLDDIPFLQQQDVMRCFRVQVPQ